MIVGKNEIMCALRQSHRMNRWFGLGLFAALAAVGCGGGSSSTTAALPTATVPVVPDMKIESRAGVPVTRSADPKGLTTAVLTTVQKYGRPRQDPFALTDEEKKFEASQASERLLSSDGWKTEWDEPEDKEANPVFEPQPPRRLMGVIVGDSVYAIIDMGDGKGQVIYPGMQIPNSPWYVVSIDTDHAILRREGTTLPKQISVKLQGAAVGLGGGGNGAPGFGGPGAATRPGGQDFGGE